ncbi:hypothetical protein ACCS68_02785 [Rhizobium beringeri]|nr:hypothetical protein [Rhizobium leguminosarum]
MRIFLSRAGVSDVMRPSADIHSGQFSWQRKLRTRMKLIGGCAAFFSSAACKVAAPIGKVKRRKTSNDLENKHFTKKEIAKRTIKLPQLY